MKITMENYFDRILENKKIPKQIKETVCSEMHHALEVSNMAVLISKELGKDKQFRDDIAVAGVLHDIGKLRVNRYVYSDEKDDTLVIEKMKYVRMHSTYSRDILKGEDYPENIIEAVTMRIMMALGIRTVLREKISLKCLGYLEPVMYFRLL